MDYPFRSPGIDVDVGRLDDKGVNGLVDFLVQGTPVSVPVVGPVSKRIHLLLDT